MAVGRERRPDASDRAPAAGEGPLVLAVDGGGTKTVLALANRDGKVVFLIHAAGSNPMDNAEWHQHLAGLFDAAVALLPHAEFAVLGIPGYGEITRFDSRTESAAVELFAGPRSVINDVEMALDGAFLDRIGILILAGTGSMAMARDGQGNLLRVGGWGEIFGDEGSAYWIGREALTEASRALDGRTDALAFASRLMSLLDLDPAKPFDALMGWCYGVPHLRSAIAAVAKQVDTLAESGEATALAILGRAADHLCAHIATLMPRIAGRRRLSWSFAGSVFESRTIRRALIKRYGRPASPRLPPIGGGLWRAAQAAGWRTDEAWVERLGRSIEQCLQDDKGSPAGLPARS